jgi:hypothetical protein
MPTASENVYEKLRSIMRAHLAELETLPPVDGRSPIISEKVCPFIATDELEALFEAKAHDFERHPLSLGNVVFPRADTLWMLWGDRKLLGRELLEIYTGPQFCAARYTTNT